MPGENIRFALNLQPSCKTLMPRSLRICYSAPGHAYSLPPFSKKEHVVFGVCRAKHLMHIVRVLTLPDNHETTNSIQL